MRVLQKFCHQLYAVSNSHPYHDLKTKICIQTLVHASGFLATQKVSGKSVGCCRNLLFLTIIGAISCDHSKGQDEPDPDYQSSVTYVPIIFEFLKGYKH
jgi:hypothetical protein